ncbi:MAG TPA: lipopolysaccharide heptosyltransferase I [Usitatibacter sp.]|nr:lipopolysaccharide heptosyltransferase I [Usitatibacter sp.]
MPAPRILLVKLSSLGDVVHLLPGVTDLAAHRPGVHVAWAVETPYAELAALHPAVSRVIPVPLRRLRDRPWSRSAWLALRAAKAQLRAQRWDFVVDAQGLIKSGCVARWARAPVFGPDRASARERFAARFYDVKIAVPREMHAVERNRRLLAQVFGYEVTAPARYGLAPPAQPPAWAPAGRYAVLLHAASRADKRWPDDRWVALGRRLGDDGYSMVLPGGNEAERADAARLAQAIGPMASAAPAMPLAEAAALLAHAAGVVGVDTGLSHLAVALGVPTVGIYCATSPRLTGLHGGALAVNLGGPRAAPDVDAVASAAGIGRGAA